MGLFLFGSNQTNSDMQQEKFETWAILELFGHQKLAGLVSEHVIAGAAFIRVDVPETPTQPPFTRFLNASAIYAINPVDKDTAGVIADNLGKKPIDAWDIKKVVEKQKLMLQPMQQALQEEELEGMEPDDMPY
jgi:hypothetical protein